MFDGDFQVRIAVCAMFDGDFQVRIAVCAMFDEWNLPKWVSRSCDKDNCKDPDVCAMFDEWNLPKWVSRSCDKDNCKDPDVCANPDKSKRSFDWLYYEMVENELKSFVVKCKLRILYFFHNKTTRFNMESLRVKLTNSDCSGRGDLQRKT